MWWLDYVSIRQETGVLDVWNEVLFGRGVEAARGGAHGAETAASAGAFV
jgi:hypothetical protein